MMETGSKQASTLFVSYAQKDEALKQEFAEYLAILQEIQLIAGWSEREVQPGAVWSDMVDPRLLLADVFIVLVSPRLLSSGYCSGAEVREAFARFQAGQLRVIPIMLYQVDVTGFPFESIQPLPRISRSVSSWPDRSEVWLSIDREIRKAIMHHRQ